MQVECTLQAGILLFKISGRLDTASAPELDAVVERELRDEHHRVAVDFSGLEYISSVGLRSLLNLGKRVDAVGGRAVICGLNGEVQKVLELSGFTRIFPTCPTTDDLAGALDG